MGKKLTKQIRFERLRVRNFRAIDELDMSFPPARMPDDPDAFVMGSRNGLGKTSVLESCALLLWAAIMPDRVVERISHEPPDMPGGTFDFGDLMIRSGASKATLEAVLSVGGQKAEIGLQLTRAAGESRLKIEPRSLRDLVKSYGGELGLRDIFDDRFSLTRKFFPTLGGMTSEPLIIPPLMYFHSYRKVQEGNPELGMMVEPRSGRWRRYGPDREVPMSTFKIELLRAMMSEKDLFENLTDSEAQDVLSILQQLMEQYAGGRIEKLRPSADNTLQFRVTPEGGESFAFDGLSSGQKEIISTLFLIWRYTHRMPGIVLIDEPELHLNVEWHRSFIRQLHELCPGNQYIVATHSEDVFGSVDEDHRVILEAERRPAKC
jgi:hypothetical protein